MNNKKFYGYIITFPNNKKYIGITNNIKQRKIYHYNKSYGAKIKNTILYNAIRKYTWEKLKWSIIEIDTWENCKLWEIENIKNLHTYYLDPECNGYNMTLGGEGTIGYKYTNEQKINISINRSGSNASMFGKKHSDETKEKQSKIALNRRINPMFGKKHSDKAKEKMRNSALNRDVEPMFGKKHSSETREVLKAAKSKEWIIIYPNGIEENIINLKSFCLKNNLDASSLRNVSIGKAKHHKGFKCIKKENDMDNNNPLMKKPPKQEKPKAQHRTAEQIAKEQAPTPNEIKTDLDRAREKAFAAYSEYMKLLTDRVLDQNKSKEKKDYEQFVVGEMYQSAGALDMISNGEGGMSLALIAVRSVLQLRDRFNELDSRINDIEKLLKRSVDKK